MIQGERQKAKERNNNCGKNKLYKVNVEGMIHTVIKI